MYGKSHMPELHAFNKRWGKAKSIPFCSHLEGQNFLVTAAKQHTKKKSYFTAVCGV